MATAQASTVAERNHAQTVTYEQARRLANQIKADWQAGEMADAQVCIQTNPQLRLHRSLVLDLAYEEFCLRLESGEPVKVDEFCKRFPSVTRSLLRRIEVHEYLLKDSQYLGSLVDIEWPVLGDRILRFWLHEELGRGTFARVYLATQAGLGNRQVVLKVASRGSQEAELLGKLKHANIVPIHSVEFDDSRNLTCLCMPFLGRSTLCDVLDRAFENGHSPESAQVIIDAARQHGTSTDEYDAGHTRKSALNKESYEDGVLRLLEQMAHGLCHAHDQRILHADLKPSNVLVTNSGDAKLLDFNLSLDQVTSQDALGGTLPYMSPEQISATVLEDKQVKIDARSDIFSFGVIAFELLNGHTPFDNDVHRASARSTADEVLARQHAGVSWPQSSRINSSFKALIDRCLAVDPDNRPESAAELVDLLRRQQKRSPRFSRWTVKRRRLFLAELSAVGASILIGAPLVESRVPRHIRLWEEGQSHLNVGRYFDARGCLAESLKLMPGFLPATYDMGRTLLYLSLYRKALDQFQETVQRSNHPPAFAYSGFCHHLLGDDRSARDWYESAAELGFNTAGVHVNLARMSIAIGFDRESARSAIAKALRLDPKSSAANYQRVTLELLILKNDWIRKKTFPVNWGDVRRSIQILISQYPKTIAVLYHAFEVYAIDGYFRQESVDIALDFLEQGVKEGLPWNLWIEGYPQYLIRHLVDYPRFREIRSNAQRLAKNSTEIPPFLSFVDPVTGKGFSPARS